MQKLLYISNGVQLEIDRVIVVPLEILNRHCSEQPNSQIRLPTTAVKQYDLSGSEFDSPFICCCNVIPANFSYCCPRRRKKTKLLIICKISIFFKTTLIKIKTA
ncbi:hypothetical protein Avbf_04584 [Armadillidium vulgare]|nr:hypothetical protein Avbf_04584 [Armadillidium vulgare]